MSGRKAIARSWRRNRKRTSLAASTSAEKNFVILLRGLRPRRQIATMFISPPNFVGRAPIGSRRLLDSHSDAMCTSDRHACSPPEPDLSSPGISGICCGGCPRHGETGTDKAHLIRLSRERASAARQQAAGITDIDIRNAYLGLARQWDLMARDAETLGEPAPAGSSVPTGSARCWCAALLAGTLSSDS